MFLKIEKKFKTEQRRVIQLLENKEKWKVKGQ